MQETPFEVSARVDGHNGGTDRLTPGQAILDHKLDDLLRFGHCLTVSIALGAEFWRLAKGR